MPIRLTVPDVTQAVLRIFYPNWITFSFFTKNWGLFFGEEIYNLTVLFLIGAAIRYSLHGLSLSSHLWGALWTVITRRVLAGGLCGGTVDLTGKTVIVTGANRGVGRGTTYELLKRGAHVIMACRSMAQGEKARRELQHLGGRAEVRHLDLASLQSVRDFAQGIVRDGVRVHILINNAGLFAKNYAETQEGFELHMGVNHLGHFLLTNLLLESMKHGQPARIINVSSIAHLCGEIDLDDIFFKKRPYNCVTMYGNSKLANVLFTRHLAHLLKGSQIEVFAVHPGAVHSEISRDVLSSFVRDKIQSVFQKTHVEGAQTTLYCATLAQQHPEMYFSDCAVGWASQASKDEVLAEKFWNLSAELVGLDS